MIEQIKLSFLPMPPTTNSMYASIFRKGSIVRIPSGPLKKFRSEMAEYHHRYLAQVHEGSQIVQDWLEQGLFLRLEIDVYYLQGRVFTKQGKAAVNDVSNRIKALEDSVAKMLRFDDREVFEVTARKKVGKNPHCDIRISPIMFS